MNAQIHHLYPPDLSGRAIDAALPRRPIPTNDAFARAWVDFDRARGEWLLDQTERNAQMTLAMMQRVLTVWGNPPHIVYSALCQNPIALWLTAYQEAAAIARRRRPH